MIESTSCPLCKSPTVPFEKHKYFTCTECFGISMSPEFYPNPKQEEDRYKEHHNDVNDKGYQNFVSPITQSVLKNYSPHHKGLDFGAGTGPVVSKMLQDKDYTIALYDPFFHPYPELLTKSYDYIVCCEVAEHFFNPYKEFALLKSLLNKGGTLFCMTHMFSEKIDFKNWYYRNDITHVFIYREETFEWIREKFGFSSLRINNRLVELKA